MLPYRRWHFKPLIVSSLPRRPRSRYHCDTAVHSCVVVPRVSLQTLDRPIPRRRTNGRSENPGSLVGGLPDAVHGHVNVHFADYIVAAPVVVTAPSLMICPGKTAGGRCPHALRRPWSAQAPRKQHVGRACRGPSPRRRF
jgi:hypothetical protein